MTVTAAIRTLIAALSLPNATATRVYVLVLPQNPTLPAVRVQRIDETETMHHRGVDWMRRARIQVDTIGGGGATAEAIDETIHDALKDYQGIVSDVDIRLIQPVTMRTMYDADELQQYKIARDYFVHYVEAA